MLPESANHTCVADSSTKIFEKVGDIGRAGRFTGVVDVRGLVPDLVADLDADARQAGDPHTAVLDPLAFEQAAQDIVIAAP